MQLTSMQLIAYLEATARLALFAAGHGRRTPDRAVKRAASAPSDAAASAGCVTTLEGDTLWTLAQRHGVSPYGLMAANPGFVAFEHLEQGQRLNLPHADGHRAPVAAPGQHAEPPEETAAASKKRPEQRPQQRRHLPTHLACAPRPIAA